MCILLWKRFSSEVWSQLVSKKGPFKFNNFIYKFHILWIWQVSTARWRIVTEPGCPLGSASLQQCFLSCPGVFTSRCTNPPFQVCCGWWELPFQDNAERENVCSFPSIHTWCSSSLKQQGMDTKTPKFSPGWLWCIPLSGLMWEIFSKTSRRNAILRMFSLLLLTMQSMGGISDSKQKIRLSDAHRVSMRKGFLWGQYCIHCLSSAPHWPGGNIFLSPASHSISSEKVSESIWNTTPATSPHAQTAYRKASWWRCWWIVSSV